jgi:hypothetical protein
MKASITNPDKISHRTVAIRENFAHYLKRAKQQAPAALARRIDREASEAERAHDIHTLSLITRRRFHQEASPAQAAQSWVRNRYRR